MLFRGTVENGRVVFDDGVNLPNGTRVEVSVRARATKTSRKKKTTGPLAQLAKYAVSTGISDLAKEHDHYLYGTPKRSKPKRKAAGKRSRR